MKFLLELVAQVAVKFLRSWLRDKQHDRLVRDAALKENVTRMREANTDAQNRVRERHLSDTRRRLREHARA
ncbi:hypothetical protein ACQU0X_14555 [Pseudovibrio ascidiaceicola]|uniref:hypothetical protein n=1 Tax=Pseudovibrio ascidiaceicola TaxID=285279 RepID=UPI003D360473